MVFGPGCFAYTEWTGRASEPGMLYHMVWRDEGKDVMLLRLRKGWIPASLPIFAIPSEVLVLLFDEFGFPQVYLVELGVLFSSSSSLVLFFSLF